MDIMGEDGGVTSLSVHVNFGTKGWTISGVSFNNASAITAPILCIGIRRPAALCDYAQYWAII